MFLKSLSCLLKDVVMAGTSNCKYKVHSFNYDNNQINVICKLLSNNALVELDLKEIITANKLQFFETSDVLLLSTLYNESQLDMTEGVLPKQNNESLQKAPALSTGKYSIPNEQKKYYVPITVMFTVLLLFSNVAEAKICNFFGYAIGAGTIIFPLLYILSDILTEVYGFVASRKVIWTAFCYSCLFSVFIYIVCLLPASEHWNGQNAFLEIFMVSPRIVVGSVTSYFVGELINTIIIASLKIKLRGEYFAFRAIVSTLIGALLESTLFAFIAFFGRIPVNELVGMITLLTIIKVLYEILLMPITIRIVGFLKRVEGISTFEKPTFRNLIPYLSE